MRGRVLLAVAVVGVTAVVSLVAGRGEPHQIVLKPGPQAGTSATLTAVGFGELDDLGRWAKQARAFKRDLDAIRRSEDPFGEVLVKATCQGLNQVADEDRAYGNGVVSPSLQDWEDFLKEQSVYLAPRYAGKLSSRLNQLNTTAQLATINPRAAHVYVQVCVRAKRY
jgi:hypothetical protein